jgi:hypothetical protein
MSEEPKENGIQRAMRVSQEQKAELDCWRWMAEMRLTVQENSVTTRPPWAVLDVDGELQGEGQTALSAIQDARQKLAAP